MDPGTGESRRLAGYQSLHDAATMWKVHSAFTLVQILNPSSAIVQKFTFTTGMNPIVFSVYRDFICICCITPVAFFSERGRRAPLDRATFGQLLLLGFVGIYTCSITVTIGISLAPAVYSSLLGITPIFVFLISAATGVEEIQWTRTGGQAKALGVLNAICGGVLLPLYNGPVIINSLRGLHSIPLSELPQDTDGVFAPTILSNLKIENWQLGVFLLIFSGFLSAVYWTLQGLL